LRERKIFEYCGLAILAISGFTLFIPAVPIPNYLLSPLLSELLGGFASPDWQYTFDYTFFTLGILAIFGCLLAKNRQWSGYGQIHKFITFINLWIFTLYLIFSYIPGTLNNNIFQHLLFNLWAISTFALAYIYYKVKLWSSNAIRVLANALHFAGLLGLWINNFIIGISLESGDEPRLLINIIITIIGLTLAIHYYLTEEKTSWTRTYKNINIANLWLTLIWCISFFSHDFFTVQIVLITLTFIMALLITRVSAITDSGSRIIANVFHATCLAGLWVSCFILAIRALDGDSTRLAINIFVTIIAFALAINYYLIEEKNLWLTTYKNINIVNLWLILLWCIGFIIRDFFGTEVILIILTFVIAFAITRIPKIADNALRIVAGSMYIIGIAWLWVFNSWPYSHMWQLVTMTSIAQIFALFALNDFINLCNTKKARILYLKIIILSTYFVLTLTQSMMIQGDISFTSAVISIMYAIIAFTWIIVGFRIRNKPLRKAGLFLSMAAVAKLLAVDTWGLSAEMRIVSYIFLGLLLMLISFIYQKLSKMLED
jgi:hypothetical protein